MRCVYILLALTVAAWAKPTDEDYVDLVLDFIDAHPNDEEEHLSHEYGDLVEGDIIVDEDGYDPEFNPFNAVVDPEKLWSDPRGIIYYYIEDEYTEEELEKIQEGIDDLVESTKVDGELCIDIVPYNGETDHVRVYYGSGCSSTVGRKGGDQNLSLTSSCVNRHGTIMHEFLHAYGFHHEHKRADRDDWVYIVEWNIQEGKEHNFEKLVEGETVDHLGTPYEYESVMHYSAYAFAENSSYPTIIPYDEEAWDIIGQRTHLADLDIERVQILYGCLDPDDSKYFKDLSPKWRQWLKERWE